VDLEHLSPLWLLIRVFWVITKYPVVIRLLRMCIMSNQSGQNLPSECSYSAHFCQFCSSSNGSPFPLSTASLYPKTNYELFDIFTRVFLMSTHKAFLSDEIILHDQSNRSKYSFWVLTNPFWALIDCWLFSFFSTSNGNPFSYPQLVYTQNLSINYLKYSQKYSWWALIKPFHSGKLP
jgi:hypothetical protein